MTLDRLGRTNQAVLSTGFFREQLAADIAGDAAFSGGAVTPLILARGFVSVQGAGERAGKVALYGVDERFWDFHGISVQTPSGREAFISPALAAELGTEPGSTVLIRTERPSDIPLESLHGRKEDAARSIRATVLGVLPGDQLGEFSLQAVQGVVRAVFLPLRLLQRELEVGSRVNALLISGSIDVPALEMLVRRHAALEDLGLSLRRLKSDALAMESASGLIPDIPATTAIAAAAEAGIAAQPMLTYLANSLRIGDREVPYSLVTAIDTVQDTSGNSPSIALNEWAARDLGAKPGAKLTMEYFLWEEPGQLVTRTAEFTVDHIVPITAGDRDMTPVYPGITDASALSDWDPPFPIDLRKVRPVDEEYWDKYGVTPKAFVSLKTGQGLWGSKYGTMTSIRLSSESNTGLDSLLTEISRRLRDRIDPLQSGMAIQDVRTQNLEASRGATNFGEYFVYFSFFLVISAVLLSALFFKLSVEQRIREVGLLRAVGLPPGRVRRIFLIEGLWLSLGGAILGAGGAILYASAIVAALRSWWIDAVGTQSIELHLSLTSILLGVIGGVLAALICIRLTLRALQSVPERALLAGELAGGGSARGFERTAGILASLLALLGAVLLAAGATAILNRTGAFFGGGLSLMAAALFFFRYRLGKAAPQKIGEGRWPFVQLGVRNAAFRPTRSVVAIATIASAAFILIAVDAFRKGPPQEGFGGYNVLAESLVPIAHDPNTSAGREALSLDDAQFGSIQAFRLRPGDDASCLNLYEPRNPRIMAPPESFLNAGGFKFQKSLAATPEQEANPWLLLHRKEADGAIPVIADANSMTYVLHRALGEDFVITSHGAPVRLRFVAALADSIFQSELLMSSENFQRLFPEQEGYSFLLIASTANDADGIVSRIEESLSAYGVDATTSAARLAEFHRVENTYLSTFQMLGGLGLVLGTAGLAAVLLRSIFERRRELALLRTFGYRSQHFLVMTIAENALLLGGGLLTGVLCALLAIAPVAISEGGRFPGAALSILLGVLGILGLLVSVAATRVALREAVLTALRSE
jgi:ABC-type antimicrobial peptide transport system permease subunit